MPSGVGARGRAARGLLAALLAVVGLLVFAAPAHAQAAPSGGIQVNKVEIGGTADATFAVTGPDDFTADLTAHVVAENTVTPAIPALTALDPGTYVITETAPIDPNSGQSVWELTDVECDGGQPEVNLGAGIVSITVSDALVTCTFTDTVTRASILALKTVIGDTSTWTRPAQFHITCPSLELDIDIEPPVGPGGPGTYKIGQGSIPPATCTISEIDTGSDGPVAVTMIMTNHGSVIATGGKALTFTSHAGDDLVLSVINRFPPIQRPEPPEQATTSTTGTTTTTIATTTTVTTSTTSSGGATTTVAPPTTSAPATTQAPLPTTGSPTGGLIVAALVAMIAGLTLVARTRRLLE